MVGTKNNRRAKYTKNVIQETVLSLLENQSMDSIKVTDVCKIADVNRTTFYRYYDDIYDCVDKIESEFLDSVKIDDTLSPMEALNHLLTAFYDNRKLSNLVFVEGKTKLLSRMKEVMMPNHPMRMQKNLQYNEVYVMSGMQGMLKKWVKDGMIQSPEQLTSIIIKVVFADEFQDLRKYVGELPSANLPDEQ